jgi:RecA-family ATPase
VQDGYEADPDARVLRTLKANYGPIGGEISLRWQGGVFGSEERETGLDRKASGAKAERVFLGLLRTFTEQGRRVNHAGGANYAPKVFAAHPKHQQRVLALSQACGTQVTRIGRITADPHLLLLSEDGGVLPNTFTSFDHFA